MESSSCSRFLRANLSSISLTCELYLHRGTSGCHPVPLRDCFSLSRLLFRSYYKLVWTVCELTTLSIERISTALRDRSSKQFRLWYTRYPGLWVTSARSHSLAFSFARKLVRARGVHSRNFVSKYASTNADEHSGFAICVIDRTENSREIPNYEQRIKSIAITQWDNNDEKIISGSDFIVK